MSSQQNDHETGHDQASRHSAEASPWPFVFHQLQKARESNLFDQIWELKNSISRFESELQKKVPEDRLAKVLWGKVIFAKRQIETYSQTSELGIEMMEDSIESYLKGCKESQKGSTQAEKRMSAILEVVSDHEGNANRLLAEVNFNIDCLEKVVSDLSGILKKSKPPACAIPNRLCQLLQQCIAEVNEVQARLRQLQEDLSGTTHASAPLSQQQLADLYRDEIRYLGGFVSHCIAEKESDTQKLSTELDASRRENDDLSQKVRDIERKLLEHNEQRQESQKERRIFNQRLVDERRQAQQEIEDLQQRIKGEDSEHQKEITLLNQQIAEEENTRRELQVAHEAEVQRLKAEHQKEKNRFNRRLRSKDSFARGLVSVHTGITKKLQLIQDTVDELKREIHGLKESKAKQIEETKLAKQEHQSSLMSLQTQRNAVSLRLAQSEVDNEHLHENFIELQAMNAALRQDHQAFVDDRREVRQFTTARNVRQEEIVLLLRAILEIAMTTAAERAAAALYQGAGAASLRSQLAEHEINVAHLHTKTDTLATALDSALHDNEEMSERLSVLLSAFVVVAMLLAVSRWC